MRQIWKSFRLTRLPIRYLRCDSFAMLIDDILEQIAGQQLHVFQVDAQMARPRFVDLQLK
jgi:hypothetical protein